MRGGPLGKRCGFESRHADPPYSVSVLIVAWSWCAMRVRARKRGGSAEGAAPTHLMHAGCIVGNASQRRSRRPAGFSQAFAAFALAGHAVGKNIPPNWQTTGIELSARTQGRRVGLAAQLGAGPAWLGIGEIQHA